MKKEINVFGSGLHSLIIAHITKQISNSLIFELQLHFEKTVRIV